MHTNQHTSHDVAFSDEITAEFPILPPVNTYFSVVIPYVAPHLATKWHPTSNVGAFSSVVRGAFKSEAEAIMWAKDHLEGNPYSIAAMQTDAHISAGLPESSQDLPMVRTKPTVNVRNMPFLVQYIDKHSHTVTFVWAKSGREVADAFECQVGLREHLILDYREAESEDIALFMTEYEKAAKRMRKEQMS